MYSLIPLWLEKQCKKVEELLKSSKTDQVFKLITKFFKNKTKRNDKIRAGNDNLILNNEDKVKRWKHYIEELLQYDKFTDVQNSGNINEPGENILKYEYNKALEEMRRNKGPGLNNIPIELIQNSGRTVKELLKFVKKSSLKTSKKVLSSQKRQQQTNVTTSDN